MIEKKTDWNLTDLRARVQNVIVTHGEKGSTIYAADEVVKIPAASISSVVDPTGAGDAFRGGFFAAKLAGLAWEQCGKVAAFCGAYALENLGTTSHFIFLGRVY